MLPSRIFLKSKMAAKLHEISILTIISEVLVVTIFGSCDYDHAE